MKRFLSILLVALTLVSVFSLAFTAFATEKSGWVKENGKWYYYDEYGELCKGWIGLYKGELVIDKSTEYVNPDATEKKVVYFTGYDWVEENKVSWYYLKTDGSMATGWTKIKNKWYYLNKSGAMSWNKWQKINKKWYCFDKNGVMLSNRWKKTDGKWYYLTSSGTMATGWQKIKLSGDPYVFNGKTISHKWYYFTSHGTMKTGWQKIDGKWYYLQEHFERWEPESNSMYGAMTSGKDIINGKWYSFDSSGAWIKGKTPKFKNADEQDKYEMAYVGFYSGKLNYEAIIYDTTNIKCRFCGKHDCISKKYIKGDFGNYIDDCGSGKHCPSKPKNVCCRTCGKPLYPDWDLEGVSWDINKYPPSKYCDGNCAISVG